MKIPELDDEAFARELEKQWVEDSKGALDPGYIPTGHAASPQHRLREYVNLRSAYQVLLHREGFLRAAVLDSESALTLLVHLRSEGVIETQDLYGRGLSQNEVAIAVGTLSQAHLAEVEQRGVSIRAEGIKYIDNLLEPSK